MGIQKADPVLRRRAIAIIAASALLLLVVAGGFLWWLRSFSTQLDADHAAGFIAAMRLTCSTLAAIALFALGFHVIVRGRRIVADLRFPARDARLIFDTNINSGKDALRIGQAAIAAGIASCIGGMALVAFVLRSILRIL